MFIIFFQGDFLNWEKISNGVTFVSRYSTIEEVRKTDELLFFHIQIYK